MININIMPNKKDYSNYKTIGDVIGHNAQPYIEIAAYVDSITNFDEQKVRALKPVLRNAYVAYLFVSELDNGGLDYYFDTQSGVYKDCLIAAFSQFSGSDDVRKLIIRANEIIDGVEKRIGDKITDNIQEITDEESDALQEINDELNELNINDGFMDMISKYLLQNADIALK